jgi:hypothetical protein
MEAQRVQLGDQLEAQLEAQRVQLGDQLAKETSERLDAVADLKDVLNTDIKNEHDLVQQSFAELKALIDAEFDRLAAQLRNHAVDHGQLVESIQSSLTEFQDAVAKYQKSLEQFGQPESGSDAG